MNLHSYSALTISLILIAAIHHHLGTPTYTANPGLLGEGRPFHASIPGAPTDPRAATGSAPGLGSAPVISHHRIGSFDIQLNTFANINDSNDHEIVALFLLNNLIINPYQ